MQRHVVFRVDEASERDRRRRTSRWESDDVGDSNRPRSPHRHSSEHHSNGTLRHHSDQSSSGESDPRQSRGWYDRNHSDWSSRNDRRSEISEYGYDASRSQRDMGGYRLPPPPMRGGFGGHHGPVRFPSLPQHHSHPINWNLPPPPPPAPSDVTRHHSRGQNRPQMTSFVRSRDS